MNNSSIEALIQYRMDQASETLRESQILLEAGCFRGAINRAYYAMYYSVQALLTSKGIKTSKHTGAISVFDQEFVKTGQFEKKFSKWLHELFDFRQEADYGPMVELSSEDTCQVLKNTEIFITKVKNYF